MSNVFVFRARRRILNLAIRNRTGLIPAGRLLRRFGQGLRAPAGSCRRTDAASLDALDRTRQNARFVPVLAEGVRRNGGLLRQWRLRDAAADLGVAFEVGSGFFG